jgi:hypothetical protein
MAKKRRPKKSPRTLQREALRLNWGRFIYRKTVSTGGGKLYRHVIKENTISFTVPAPCTDRDIVNQIAAQSMHPIPIDLISAELAIVSSRGEVCFGCPGNKLDQIAKNYKDVYFAKLVA